MAGEVLSGPERRRRWGSEEKTRLVAEIMVPGAKVTEITRRRGNAHTLKSFIEEIYRPWAEANIRTATKTIARLSSSFADLLSKKLGDITAWQLEKWRADRLKAGNKPIR